LHGLAELRSARYRAVDRDRVVPLRRDPGAIIDPRGKEGEGVLVGASQSEREEETRD